MHEGVVSRNAVVKTLSKLIEDEQIVIGEVIRPPTVEFERQTVSEIAISVHFF